MRMVAQTPEIENGNVMLPAEAPWLTDHLYELTSFPKAKYDDQVDSTAQAIKWIATEGREPPFFTFMYMDMAERFGITVDEARNRIKSKSHQFNEN